MNHWDLAIESHASNHPATDHVCAPVEGVDPRNYRKMGIDVIFASPSCTHHSRARGNRPVKDQQRASGWDVLKWMEELRPSYLVVENVPEWCFPAETAVLTKRGVVPISSVEVGDQVWTHNSRWKPVTAVQKRVSDMVRVKGLQQAAGLLSFVA